MVLLIGGIQPTTYGNVGESMADWMVYLLLGLGGLVALLLLNGFRIWWTRVRPRQPKLHADWAADCEHITSAVFNDSIITFRNVRDFHWRTTRDRDEKWADEVTVDST